VELGEQYQVEMGIESEPRDVRIVWTQDEADGQIVGVQFLDGEGSVPPPPARRKSAAPQAKVSTAPPKARTTRPPSTDPKRSKGASPASKPPKDRS
jgi:hypothetical protein